MQEHNKDIKSVECYYVNRFETTEGHDRDVKDPILCSAQIEKLMDKKTRNCVRNAVFLPPKPWLLHRIVTDDEK